MKTTKKFGILNFVFSHFQPRCFLSNEPGVHRTTSTHTDSFQKNIVSVYPWLIPSIPAPVHNTHMHRGSCLILLVLIAVPEAHAYNIPLRIQTETSCGTTALAMVMDTWNESHSQAWWDICANRMPGGYTYLNNIQLCVHALGYKFKPIHTYYARNLKTGDIVIAHSRGYTNSSDLHMYVVECVDTNSKHIILANPWGRYDTMTFQDFDNTFTGHGLRILSKNGYRDERLISKLNNGLMGII